MTLQINYFAGINFRGLFNKQQEQSNTLKEETFAVSRFLAKSAKVYSREIFQKTSSAKVSKKVVICEYSEKNTLL